MKNIIRGTLIVILTGVFCFSGFRLFQMSEGYISEAQVRDGLSAYGPSASNDARPPETNSSESAFTGAVFIASQNSSEAILPDSPPAGIVVNQNIIDMQNEINRDVAGWLTIPGTKIDYPFVKGADNEHYVGRDLYGNDALAGSIFMDERNAPDLTDFNTILYGHNMRNGTMFGELPLFADDWYFNNNKDGALYLAHGTYALEIFAYMVVRADDEFIYNPTVDGDIFFAYIEENARNYREPATRGSVVTLSACAYEFDSARVVIIASVSAVL